MRTKGAVANNSVGLIMRLRISPRDVMSAIDIADRAGVVVPGMSLSAVVKRAIVVAFASLRDAAAIPTRDGFEYNEMIARFPGNTLGEKVLKAGIGHALVVEDMQREMRDIPPPALHLPHLPQHAAVGDGGARTDGTPTGHTPTVEEIERKLEEMRATRAAGVRPPVVMRPDPAMARIHARIRMLEGKRDADPENWSESEQTELDGERARLAGGPPVAPVASSAKKGKQKGVS